MIVRLTKITPKLLALTFMLIHAIIGVIIGSIVAVGSLLNPEAEGIWSWGAWALVLIPAINAVLGFVTGLFLSGAYNLIRQWVGGIELEFDQQDKVSLSATNL